VHCWGLKFVAGAGRVHSFISDSHQGLQTGFIAWVRACHAQNVGSAQGAAANCSCAVLWTLWLVGRRSRALSISPGL